ncbi:Uu.00g075410.m01.CDS01 [Anthostomella pinea]|uniref:Uu.00g075410.m01.CDS01 n=1 Tax=Anthostomella pinea TaxID=933095 RepID=A0AAI8YP92_9PEZI|nr:Uu.00g075410.m01.CDS01 [Anthostomella pinea]
MHLLLIRHGDAGSRDAPLTNHGVVQTKRLGAHLVSRRSTIGPIRHIFASNLQRAYNTAGAIVEAQQSLLSKELAPIPLLEVVQLPELREKDFGSSEGVNIGSREGDGGPAHTDSESRDAMKARIDRFLASHLLPVVDKHATENVAVVIVAHGIILNVLLRALLARGTPKPILSQPQPTVNEAGGSEYLAAWSNTGVLQAKVTTVDSVSLDPHAEAGTSDQGPVVAGLAESSPGADPPNGFFQVRFHLTIQLTNDIDHLKGLKKTRGGIGSAKFDPKQRTVDLFFGSGSKKRKLEESNKE